MFKLLTRAAMVLILFIPTGLTPPQNHKIKNIAPFLRCDIILIQIIPISLIRIYRMISLQLEIPMIDLAKSV